MIRGKKNVGPGPPPVEKHWSITPQSTYLPCWSCRWTCCGPCTSPCSSWPGRRCLPSRLWSAAAGSGLTWWNEGPWERDGGTGGAGGEMKQMQCMWKFLYDRVSRSLAPAAGLSTVSWRRPGACCRSARGGEGRLPRPPPPPPPPLGEASRGLPAGGQASARNTFPACCEGFGAKSDTWDRK